MANNKKRGSSYEREKRRELIDLGYDDVVTTRAESRSFDAAGVDLMGRSLPFYVQCKLTNGRQFNFYKWYKERTEGLPDDKPTFVFNRITAKSEKGRFMNDGEYVIMKIADFYDLIRRSDE